MSLRALLVASEAFPLVKTGGLADVVGALPAALAPHAVSATILLPGYPAVMKAHDAATVLHRWTDFFGGPAALLRGPCAGLDLIALDAPHLFARGGGIYQTETGRDWPDNWRRFAALAHVGADLASGRIGPGFDILHAHDWQAALAPAYLHFEGGPPCVVTIHNMAFQGKFDADIFPQLGLPPQALAIDGVEYYGGIGFLKAGLWAADAITTVSPTYAAEIHGSRFGMGLEGLIRLRSDRVCGIVNGIDTAIWDPAGDPHLTSIYDADCLDLRAENKRALEAAFGLNPSLGPLFCVISRLTEQKGMDVLAAALDALVGMGGRLALLGSGDRALEASFRAAALRHAGRIGVKIGYDETLSHLLQGGADAILIPSRFEPCGLTQLYGLRYGCVPVAARTGGLADTIIDANQAALAMRAATGLLFAPLTQETLIGALHRAGALFSDRAAWRAMQVQGMKADLSWSASGKEYAALYARLAQARPADGA